MGVAPDPQEILRQQALIDAAVREISDRFVLHRHGHHRGLLPLCYVIFHIERIILGRDAKAADLGLAEVAEELQLQPGQRSKGELRLSAPVSRPSWVHGVHENFLSRGWDGEGFVVIGRVGFDGVLIFEAGWAEFAVVIEFAGSDLGIASGAGAQAILATR